ncbi:MAG: GNAT family N-acetyltransferase [Actinobacteria bacterium]|jgi:GNAT superfamily N-acetyltransferase|nr:GNAT family N-acetyltransferase [Actinomycetota bacterium]MBT4477624.1 GNAT family N-acetyltransferase [Actinomycetota bacterium]MBT4655668.1 GNAT family N-acetyltransferase [Actinomycetota bacterium]MBT5117837.1 GNAT family N-acetyltransferase [Actinomycetota bacterium]MBT7132159.1 GNAT family N-acetyltransferase [Actinomycetota bacterium]
MTDLTYTNLHPKWAEQLTEIEHTVFASIDLEDLLSLRDMEAYCRVFPEGGFVALDGDTPVGFGLGILLDFDFEDTSHSLDDLTGEEDCGNHNPDGDWYYGVTIAVNPQYRKRGIGNRLYELRKEVVRTLNKKGIVAGGVIPGYAKHLNEMTADQYIDQVVAGNLHDPTLSFQIANGFQARGAIPDYLDDPTVGNNAVLIVWENTDYQP